MQITPNILGCASAASFVAAGIFFVNGTFRPSTGFWGEVICAGPTEPPQVAVTFDDGPDEIFSNAILDELGKLGVKATFFVIGSNAKKWPRVVRRMHDEGHLVGNHTMDHEHLAMFRGWSYWKKQVNETDQLIADIIGQKPAMFRPPMGIMTRLIYAAAHRSGHKLIGWSRRSLDGVTTLTSDILERLEGTHGGEIVVLHDGIDPHQKNAAHRDRSPTVAAIRPLIEELRSRHLKPVRLDELLSLPAYAPQ